jgi:hypothetical protein
MSDSSFDCLGGNYYISAASLLLEYKMFIDSHPTLFKVNAANAYWPKLVFFCEELEAFPEIMRAITRLHINSQIDFERALFCSWCSLLIARSFNLPDANQRVIFLAGLLQDIGKHTSSSEVIPFPSKAERPLVTNIHSLHGTSSQPSVTNLASITNNASPFKGDSHALTSASITAKHLPELKGLSELVLYHHAKNDGTGCPLNISESQLDLDHQILIVANEISDRLDGWGGHNQICHTMANLKLNAFLYFNKVHLSWFKLLEPHVVLTSEPEEEEVSIVEVSEKVEQLEKTLSSLLVVSAELLPYDFDLNVHSLRMMISRLMGLSTESDVFSSVMFNQRIDTSPSQSAAVLRDTACILKGLPEIFSRMMLLLDDILCSRKYDINISLIQKAKEQLYQNIKKLEVKRCSIFR